jgi:hypothetical protein
MYNSSVILPSLLFVSCLDPRCACLFLTALFGVSSSRAGDDTSSSLHLMSTSHSLDISWYSCRGFVWDCLGPDLLLFGSSQSEGLPISNLSMANDSRLFRSPPLSLPPSRITISLADVSYGPLFEYQATFKSTQKDK